MGKDQKIVIVGASLTGAKAAETLLEEGFEGEVTLLGSEVERPYERPPLSKEYLRGEKPEVPHVHEAEFYDSPQVDLRTSATVTAIRPEDSAVIVDESETVAYDRLLIATGARPRHLDLPGSDLDGISYLRTVGDSRTIGDQFRDGLRVVVVGAGWIGSEVAASARQKGCEVTLIEPEDVPLKRVLGPELGAFYRDIHVNEGVNFMGGTGVSGFSGDRTVSKVLTDGGDEIPADLVVVGVGVIPRSELADAAGLKTDNGVLVDSSFVSSNPDVFAAGDVANAWYPFYGRHIRVEHWANARRQGAAAARSMLSLDPDFDQIPYFFSDQYDVGMEYVGYTDGTEEVVFRGDVSDGEFIAFWVKDGKVRAGMNVNIWDVSEPIRDLIKGEVEVSTESLADPDVNLTSLLPD
ncbi:MAG: FAD-dependent oxidoreductase [Solirubrobacterales bacterium]